jgi:hypothetical protein
MPLVVVGVTFIFGTLTLIIAMLYIRAVGRRRRGTTRRQRLADIHPPPFKVMVLATYLAMLSTLAMIINVLIANTTLWKTVFVLSGFLAYYGSFRMMKNWDNPRQRVIMDFCVAIVALLETIFLLLFFDVFHKLPSI